MIVIIKKCIQLMILIIKKYFSFSLSTSLHLPFFTPHGKSRLDFLKIFFLKNHQKSIKKNRKLL